MVDERGVRMGALHEALMKLSDVQMILGRATHPPDDWHELESAVRLCTRETARLLEAQGRVPEAIVIPATRGGDGE